MVSRPIVLAVLCLGLFLILQALVPKAMALRSNIDRYMIEDQKTHKRKNYMVQGARNKDVMGSLEGIIYENEPFDPDRNPEELSAFIVDYANMIRNDVILLDKSVETRTRKRGNIKVKKYNNQAISDPPCSCEYNETIEDLGQNVFPKRIKVRNCSRSQRTCVYPYVCQENYYNLPILRQKPTASDSIDSVDVPDELQPRWIGEKIPISVGCVCKREYWGPV